jgi:hypothetical protein
VSDAPISIIEQAAKRLAELKRAGIDAPDADTATLVRPMQDVPATPSLERAVNRLAPGDSGLFSGPMPGTGPVHAASQAAARASMPPLAEVEPPRAPV